MSEEIKNKIEEYYKSQIWMRKCGMNIVLARIQNMQTEIESMGREDIVYDIESRLKTFESAYEKIGRKGLSMSEKGIDDMYDIAGIRVIVPYVSDIYTIRDLIKRPAALFQKEAVLKVVKERDYVKEPKENGYRAYHIVVNVKATWQKKSITVPVEIQIMTPSMKLWSHYEHKLVYKNRCPVASEIMATLKENLREMSNHLSNFDKTVEETEGYLQHQKDAKEYAEENAALAEKIITIADVKAASAANS